MRFGWGMKTELLSVENTRGAKLNYCIFKYYLYFPCELPNGSTELRPVIVWGCYFTNFTLHCVPLIVVCGVSF